MESDRANLPKVVSGPKRIAPSFAVANDVSAIGEHKNRISRERARDLRHPTVKVSGFTLTKGDVPRGAENQKNVGESFHGAEIAAGAISFSIQFLYPNATMICCPFAAHRNLALPRPGARQTPYSKLRISFSKSVAYENDTSALLRTLAIIRGPSPVSNNRDQALLRLSCGFFEKPHRSRRADPPVVESAQALRLLPSWGDVRFEGEKASNPFRAWVLDAFGARNSCVAPKQPLGRWCSGNASLILEALSLAERSF